MDADFTATLNSDRQRFEGRRAVADATPDPSAKTPASHWSHLKYTRVVSHGGHQYLASATMASIFLAHAGDAIERGDSELVPLLHKDGIELLLIGPGTSFSVTEAATAIPAQSRPAAS